MKKAALITVHGMGTTAPDYNTELCKELHDRLGRAYDDLHVGAVYYQGILQPRQERVWGRVAKKVRWDDLRKFLLFGFSDAAGLEAGKDLAHSVYTLAQIAIARELYLAYRAVGPDGSIVLLAQSLGGQVTSCYFWDAVRHQQRGDVSVGIWKDIQRFQVQISGNDPLTPELLSFLQGKTFRYFFTTGCNIPIFVAAHAAADVKPIRPNSGFVWNNYYDKDDVLGWPLSELSDEYGQLVRDHQIDAGGGLVGWIVKSWNPMSHTQYWRDDEILDPLEGTLRDLIDRG